jgi:hypothetical protein
VADWLVVLLSYGLSLLVETFEAFKPELLDVWNWLNG